MSKTKQKCLNGEEQKLLLGGISTYALPPPPQMLSLFPISKQSLG